jgi:signal transduction histidine kinase
LVKNGIEAAEGSGVRPTISMTVETTSEADVRVLVSDNGPGLDPSVRERLFEPSVSTKRDGSGLGLAIVQTIVHEHGGEVHLREDGPSGATFEVTLPLDGPPQVERMTTPTFDPESP